MAIVEQQQEEQTATMSPQRWLVGLIAATGLVLALHFLLVWRLDVYGLYRDPHGRQLTTASRERKAKFLLNGRYVPANFDALVVGGSSSLNWQLDQMGNYHFYNESMQGANATEERLLVERAMHAGKFRLALVGINPHVTAAHEEQDGIGAVDLHEPLGSLNELEMELFYLMGRFGRHTGAYPDGSHDMPEHKLEALASYKPGAEKAEIDAKALDDYKALLTELAGSGTKLVYVVYPMYEPYYESDRAALTSYEARMQRELPPGPVIDFTAPEYTSFCNDASNFIDEVHLSAKGTRVLSPILIERVRQALQ